MQQSEICCVCIVANLELISISETDPYTIKYSSKLSLCVPEVVWNEDDRICERCIEQLEAACAFRDLCLQSQVIRQQLLVSCVPDSRKSEEVTVDDVVLPIMKDTHQLITMEESPADLNTNYCLPEINKTSNQSYLRHLLQNSHELLKATKYTGGASYLQYIKHKDYLEITLPIMKENLETAEKNLKKLEEETKELTETKTCNMQEDGMEVIDQNVKRELSNKSLLRELLLQPKITNSEINFTKEHFGLLKPATIIQKCYLNNQRLSDTLHIVDYYQCKHCALTFKARSELVRHNEDAHQFSRPWDCIYCTNSFKTLPELEQHESTHANQRNYKCSICCKSYTTMTALAKHKIFKHGSPDHWRYLRSRWDEERPSKVHQVNHLMQNYTKEVNGFVCMLCKAEFSSRLLLVAHVQYKHNSEIVLKRCAMCQNTYTKQVDLESHIFHRHNLETIKFPKKIKQYKCDKCFKLYTTLKAKNSHRAACDGIRRHTSNKLQKLI